MKKIIIPLMAIAAFATACQVEDLNEANQGQQNGELFTIEAAITPSTKTSLTVEADSYKVDWDADDALSVVAKYSDGSYSGNEFTKGEGNTFSGTVTNPGDITELNVVYPYDDYIKDIDSEGYFNGYVYFGSRSDESQNQTGLNSAAHINGPLYGYATVSSENTVVQMKHASTLFEINVTNNSGIDINVSNIKLTNSESKNMVGIFYINPQTGALKEGKYVASTVSLNASNATITNGETGNFYITSAPFELAANSNITVTVTANGQETEIVKTVSKATSFVAGTVNHLNVTIKEAQEIQPIEEGQYLIGAYTSSGWAIMTAILNTSSSNDYFEAEERLNTNKQITEISCSDFYGIPTITDDVWTISDIDNGYSIQSNNTSKYLSFNALDAEESDSPVTLSIIANTDGTYSIADPSNSNNVLKYNSSSPRFKPYSSTNTMPLVVLIPWIDDTTPRIFISETSQTVNYDATSVTFSYSTRNIDGNINVNKSDNSNIISEISVSDGIVSVTLNPNTENTEKNATIELSYTGADTVELRITQNAAPGEDTKYYVKVTEEPADWSGQYLIVYEEQSIALDGSLTKIDAAQNYTTVSIQGNQIMSTSETDGISFKFEQISGGYSIKSKSGYYIYNTTGKNSIATSTTETGINEISYNTENNTCSITSNKLSLLFYSNNTANQQRFRYYTSEQKAISLYKLQ